MTPQYRKLPGRLRGFIQKSSVWAGPDHLLLVRGSRFREEYKRFYFRDVQAIAMARAPRYHFSPGWSLLILLLVITVIITLVRGYNGPASYALVPFGLLMLLLTAAWIRVSNAGSCRCRIYTAVSAEELPCIYRLRTARKFLAAVEPLIAQTQGVLEGDWAKAAEERGVGPAAVGVADRTTTEAAAEGLPRRTLTSDLFLVSLLADAAAKIAPLPTSIVNLLPFVIELITVAAAVAVIVQYNRGRLRAGMHKVAIALLIAFGVLYYAQSTTVGISAGLSAAKTKKRIVTTAFPRMPWIDRTGAGIDAILMIVGLALSLSGDEDKRRGLLDEA